MNTISHALAGYAASAVIFGPETAQQYAVPILISSTIMDLDHIPYLVKHFKSVIHGLKIGHANPYLQGNLHRVHSQLALLIAMLLASFFIRSPSIGIVSFNFFLHMAIDALMDSKYHAFFPFSHNLLSIKLFGRRWPRTVIDFASIPLFTFFVWSIY